MYCILPLWEPLTLYLCFNFIYRLCVKKKLIICHMLTLVSGPSGHYLVKYEDPHESLYYQAHAAMIRWHLY